MGKSPNVPDTVDAYIARFPPEVRAKLQKIRSAIRKAAPGAEERMAYRMPAYWHDGPLVYFAAFKKHIGFYPLPEAIGEFAERLAPYAASKGAVQFPIDEEPPLDLVRDIVRFRAAANEAKAAAGTAKPAAKGK
jgi:uncharacterized protein YdhG (YjbR/CyaY superfamily)